MHTGRELALMLAGTKPFAHFSDVYPSLPGVEVIPERLFNPYVAAGRFVKREYVALRTESPPPNYPQLLGTRCVLYSTSREEWRIDAFIELLAKGATYG